jgi:hypothetical protein
MNILQIQQQLRFTRIEEYLSEHGEIVASKAAFQEDFAAYQEALAALAGLAQQQVPGSKGQTAAKKAARRKMAELVLELSSLVRLYAEKKGDLVTAAGVKTTLSELFYLRGSNALSKAAYVVEAARTAQPEMVKDYNLTSQQVDEAAAAVEAFRVMLNAPALAIDAHSVTTQAIDGVIAELCQMVSERITVHVETMRRAHPAFAAAYDQVNTLEKRRGTQQKTAAVEETPAAAQVARGAEPVSEAPASVPVAGGTPAPPRVAGTVSSNGSRNGNGVISGRVDLAR